jgi:hypothetical protein
MRSGSLARCCALDRRRRAARASTALANEPFGIRGISAEGVAGISLECLAHERRCFPRCRLDQLSEGLILLTSPGDIVNGVLRAENKPDKVYLLAVNPAGDAQVRAGYGPRRAHPRRPDPAVPDRADCPVRPSDRAHQVAQPADLPDERGFRLSRHPTAPRAHQRHSPGRVEAAPLALPS